ncbi:VWA domain-containing protein [Jannaschia seohaensis]|uniref:Magnesium chelatase subunit D n=1 Tax=Jannaschia seohaensis TaxID=475081 RepID=A0A2Y9A093_9RHOB|nr:VWA domain-containing protein [Jannaschia seohaensis]PWJ21693.1 magnesium chelatase subunit D [Jannaschia seohaensis]SSA37971.1 magnesium chelatase subunit D [Jannaschia seohaensis]
MTDPWAVAVRAAHCLAREPLALGGLHLRARSSDARNRLLRLLHDFLPGAARLHPDTGDEALFGGLDLSETLRSGRPVTRAGLLARCDTLILAMAERATPALAARLGQALDGGGHTLIALDEGAESEERLAPALADRLAISLDLEGLRASDMPGLTPLDDEAPADAPAERLAALSVALGIGSIRRPRLALLLARASAQIDGRDTPSEADLAFAVTCALAPHATRLPPDPAEEEAADRPASDDAPPPAAENDALPEGDLLLEAALASLPPDLLERLAQGPVPRATGLGTGAARKGNRRGRPLPPRPGRPDGRARIDLVATLRAAAPWQTLRGAGPGQTVQVRAGDIRLKRYETRSDRLVIFAVDASGSAAFARLGEVKGAVELLLAQAYSRRDHVALVSFRGTQAECLLPPTRSLLRTRKELSGLPGGGGTPLAAGLRTALEQAVQARGRGMDPAVVLLTDGRPNVALSGRADRAEAIGDATAMGRALRAAGVTAMVIDAGNRPSPALRDLAREMGADCLPLPRADAARLSHAVSDALG